MAKTGRAFGLAWWREIRPRFGLDLIAGMAVLGVFAKTGYALGWTGSEIPFCFSSFQMYAVSYN